MTLSDRSKGRKLWPLRCARRDNHRSRDHRVANTVTATSQLVLAANRAGAGDVFFNRGIAGISNFSCAGNGDFQRFGNCDFRVACACRGDFRGLGLQSARLQLASPGHISKKMIDVPVERNT